MPTYKERKVEEILAKYNRKEIKSAITGFGGVLASTLILGVGLSLNAQNIEKIIKDNNPSLSQQNRSSEYSPYLYNILPCLFLGLGFSMHRKNEEEFDEELEKLKDF